jgi:hypothetical protein
MGFFGKKKDKFVDLSAGYMSARKMPSSNANQVRRTENSDLGFIGDMANNSSTSDNISWDNEPVQPQTYVQDKKQKLAKRFLEMTERIEDLSNQIYHLKQRIELLEKKMKISFD